MSEHTLRLFADQSAPEHKTDTFRNENNEWTRYYNRERLMENLSYVLLLIKTVLRRQIPGGGEQTTTNVKGQPISVSSMLIRCNLGFTLRVCDAQKQKKKKSNFKINLKIKQPQAEKK